MKSIRAFVLAFAVLVLPVPAYAVDAVPFDNATPLVTEDGTEIFCVFDISRNAEGTITGLRFADCSLFVAPDGETASVSPEPSIAVIQAAPDPTTAPLSTWASDYCEAVDSFATLVYRYRYFTDALAGGTVQDALTQSFYLRSEAKDNHVEFERIMANAPEAIRRVANGGVAVTDAMIGLTRVYDRAASQPERKTANTRLLRRGVVDIRRSFPKMAEALKEADAQYPDLCALGGGVND